jgi:Txe/YoeB family toxin of Txe-Axe toxin-antitoxin module
MHQKYEYVLSSRFKSDCDSARRNSAIRSRIDNLHLELSAPFKNGKNAEKLVGSAYPNRYSLRVNDNYRVIFDLVGNTLVYRALSSHEESYRRAKVLPPPNLSKVARFADIYKPVAKHYDRSSDPLPKTTVSVQSIPESALSTAEDSALLVTSGGLLLHESADGGPDESYVLLGGVSEITTALASDIAEWMLFLPEEHRRYITQRFNGPARIFGPSGTGKTCILLHRAVHLAQLLQAPVLIVTFRPTLAKVITRLKERLCARNPGTDALVTVLSLNSLAYRIAGIDEVISAQQHEDLIRRARLSTPPPPATLLRKLRKDQDIDSYASNEVLNWIKGTAYKSREIYQALDFPKGKGQLSALEREWFFDVFEAYEKAKGMSFDEQDLLICAEANLAGSAIKSEWKAILVDEFQDLNLCGLSLLKRVAGEHTASLFFAGDHRQRIYRTLPSFREAGVPIVGRSFGLSANYRNTPEIYSAAKSLYGSQGDDPDSEGLEAQEIKLLRDSSRKPVIRGFRDSKFEDEWICKEITSLIERGLAPGDIALISLAIEQSESVNWDARFPVISLDNPRVERLAYFHEKSVKRSTIHEVKGLEFPVVFVMGLSAEVFGRDAILRSEDDADSVIGSLLYVAMTRARDQLYLSFSGNPVALLHAAKPTHFEMDPSTKALLSNSI